MPRVRRMISQEQRGRRTKPEREKGGTKRGRSEKGGGEDDTGTLRFVLRKR